MTYMRQLKARFLVWWFGFRYFRECDHCLTSPACRYHQRTCYPDASLNIVTLCAECKTRNDEHWDDMWYEYESGLL